MEVANAKVSEEESPLIGFVDDLFLKLQLPCPRKCACNAYIPLHVLF